MVKNNTARFLKSFYGTWKWRAFLVFVTVFLTVGFLFMIAAWDVRVPCPIYAHTGIHCPFCGCTRLYLALLDGCLYEAFRFNPFMFLSAIPLCVLYIREAPQWIRTGVPTKGTQAISSFWILSCIIFGIMRNVPVLSFLAP